MDAKDFIKERKRMCDYYYGDECKRNGEYCPLDNYPCDSVESLTEIVIDEVENWSKTHPIKTRQRVFLEQHPNAKIKDGVLTVCPQEIDTTVECYSNMNCSDCCREYWEDVVE